MTAAAAKRRDNTGLRRDLVIDAAISVLAEGGARRLTHRAIDQYLRMPEGTTSNYFRRRDQLILAISQRILDIDVAAMKECLLGGGGHPVTPQRVAQRLSGLWIDWLTPKNRDRVIARFEILLDAHRAPVLSDLVEMQSEQIKGLWYDVFIELGVPSGRARSIAFDFLTIVRGLLFSQALLTRERRSRPILSNLIREQIELHVARAKARHRARRRD